MKRIYPDYRALHINFPIKFKIKAILDQQFSSRNTIKFNLVHAKVIIQRKTIFGKRDFSAD
ncbi:hypothetical protein ACJX0J_017758, partial [Zea mays]